MWQQIYDICFRRSEPIVQIIIPWLLDGVLYGWVNGSPGFFGMCLARPMPCAETYIFKFLPYS